MTTPNRDEIQVATYLQSAVEMGRAVVFSNVPFTLEGWTLQAEPNTTIRFSPYLKHKGLTDAQRQQLTKATVHLLNNCDVVIIEYDSDVNSLHYNSFKITGHIYIEQWEEALLYAIAHRIPKIFNLKVRNYYDYKHLITERP